MMIKGSGFGLYHGLIDPDPGGPKTYRSDGSGSAILVACVKLLAIFKQNANSKFCIFARKIRHLQQISFQLAGA